jgi:hypothetical protein
MTEPYPHFLEDIYHEMEDCANAAPLVPSQIRRLFLSLVRAHWSDAENHGPNIMETLRCLTWNPDPGLSMLQIELAGSENQLSPTHAIWLNVGNYRFENRVMGGRTDPDEDNARETYTMFGNCQVLVSHEAPTMDQALDMAWSTLGFFIGFRESILDALGGEIAQFYPEILGEPKMQSPTPKGMFRVDVGAKLAINVSVSAVFEDHKLKRVATYLSPL